MNRNCPPYLREISTNQAIRDTERWVVQSRERFSAIRSRFLTPRFIPSCTDDLMYALSRLRENTICRCRAICLKTSARSNG